MTTQTASAPSALEQKLNELEQQRGQMRGVYYKKWLALAVAVVAIVLAGVFAHHLGLSSKIVIFIIVPMIAAGYAWVSATQKNFQKRYKEAAMPVLISKLSNASYSISHKVDTTDFRKSTLLDTDGLVEEAEDYISFNTQQTKVELFKGQADTFITGLIRRLPLPDIAKNAIITYSEQDPMEGIFIRLTFPHRFPARVKFVENYTQALDWTSRFTNDGMQKVTLESVEFEKEFDVYADDQIAARAIFTPRQMENLIQLKKTFSETLDAPSLRGAFINNTLLLVIETEQELLTAPTLGQNATDKQHLQALAARIKAILTVANITEDVFKKA